MSDANSGTFRIPPKNEIPDLGGVSKWDYTGTDRMTMAPDQPQKLPLDRNLTRQNFSRRPTKSRFWEGISGKILFSSSLRGVSKWDYNGTDRRKLTP